MTFPYDALDRADSTTPENLLKIPGPDQHPVLIARHMLLLANFLQHLHPNLYHEMESLPESPRAIMERLAHLASSHVTTNDRLLGSIEGLECIIIETSYQANMGNLRRSWVLCRRAISIAQLMGLNKSNNQAQYKVLDPETMCHPHLMWFRIVALDRQLSLMLGLPQASPDKSMASEAVLANDTPIGRLERIHCVIASRILERNESHYEDDTLTRTLDLELQVAAKSLPSKWWLVPKLAASTDTRAQFWDARRLFAQIVHYNLLNQLHLPYMLRSSSTQNKHEYSRITCINASRDILSRFTTLRNFNGISYSCRIIDFLTLMAAMTLLLAHLDSHHAGAENLLSHQYYSDRAMIEQVQENMEEVNSLYSDALSAQSADLLRRLLTIEVDPAEGTGDKTVSVQEAGTPPDNDAAVSVHIPYFGIIKIAREGISQELATTNELHQMGAQNSSPEPTEPSRDSDCLRLANGGRRSHASASLPTPTYSSVEEHATAVSIPDVGENPFGSHYPPYLHDSLADPLWQYAEEPDLAAGGEDWAFQGVDMAFFENLMRSTRNETNEDAEWSRVQ
ncbi:MAG: hypothetical protein M1820_002368 [Bogoriella megaspora]|nr:MAG: hypothetical protein M1820_002368 [Bogoriella megaspora]